VTLIKNIALPHRPPKAGCNAADDLVTQMMQNTTKKRAIVSMLYNYVPLGSIGYLKNLREKQN
jgi:hypothetical protein